MVTIRIKLDTFQERFETHTPNDEYKNFVHCPHGNGNNSQMQTRYYLPTPPLGQDMTQGQFLSRVLQVWIQSFPSPRLVAFFSSKVNFIVS